MLSEDQTNVSEHFPKTFYEDCRRFPKINEESRGKLMMFPSYSNTCKYFKRDSVTIAMVIVSACENNLLFSGVNYHEDMFMCESSLYFNGLNQKHIMLLS